MNHIAQFLKAWAAGAVARRRGDTAMAVFNFLTAKDLAPTSMEQAMAVAAAEACR